LTDVPPEIFTRLKRLEIAVERLYEHAGLDMPELPGADEVSEEVYALVLDGKLLEAIQLQRQQTGADLAAAKSAIDRIRG
jgi:hypothetical protein